MLRAGVDRSRERLDDVHVHSATDLPCSRLLSGRSRSLTPPLDDPG
jgi:hypothetical protein